MENDNKQQKLMNTYSKFVPNHLLVLCGVRRCSFFVLVRVFDKYFKTKVDAESIEDAEQIIKNTIIGFEYQIMNIYKTNE